jgi:hypothetical protein
MLIALSLVLQLASAAIPAPTGSPMKSPMGYILNSVLNGELKQAKLEAQPLVMKNYQLFVYVGQKCSNCSAFLAQLNELASSQKKSVNVVLVYDYSTKLDDSLIQSAASSSSFEFFDGQGHMYYNLFHNPRYLNFILTGPQHTIIKSGLFSNVEEVSQLNLIIKK